VVAQDKDLPGTIRFAFEATRDLDPSYARSKTRAVAGLAVGLGREIAKTLAADSGGGALAIVAELPAFWSENRLGEMEIALSGDPTIRLDRCSECGDHATGGSGGRCAFNRSLLESIFRESLGTRARVEELECCKTGGTRCVFQLTFP
jgi:predicted hydrocarbon binding protein